jgi:hypothetical protein
MQRLSAPPFIDIWLPEAWRGLPLFGASALTGNVRIDASKAFVMSARFFEQ